MFKIVLPLETWLGEPFIQFVLGTRLLGVELMLMILLLKEEVLGQYLPIFVVADESLEVCRSETLAVRLFSVVLGDGRAHLRLEQAPHRLLGFLFCGLQLLLVRFLERV